MQPDQEAFLLPRLADVWPGRNRPVCAARCLLGPRPSRLGVTLGIMLGLFLGLQLGVAPYCGFEAHARAGASALFALSLALLARVALTEPGILPRRMVLRDTEFRRPPDAGAPVTQTPAGALAWRYCDTCNIFRPPGAKHCRECDNCVREFDHHCFWISTCIGERNYAAFVCLVTSMAAYAGFVGWVSARVLRRGDFVSVLDDRLLALVEACASALVGLPLVALALYHYRLVLTESSTFMDVLDLPPSQRGGAWFNVRRVFCRRTRPSEVDLQATVDVSVSRFLPTAAKHLPRP